MIFKAVSASELIYGKVLDLNLEEKSITIYDIYSEQERTLSWDSSQSIPDLKPGDRIRLWVSDQETKGSRKIVKIYRNGRGDRTGIRRRLRKALHSGMGCMGKCDGSGRGRGRGRGGGGR